MSAHGVADAQANLPKLIDRALVGKEIVITRHGEPVAELRPAAAPALRLSMNGYAPGGRHARPAQSVPSRFSI